MAQYTDNQFKFVAVLNKRIGLPQLLNALGHISAGLTSTLPDNKLMEFLEYNDSDGTRHPAISKFPFIILTADNGNQIRRLRAEAIDAKILYNDFTGSMIGQSAEEQLKQTRAAKELELEYFAILMFGPSEKLNVMTKRFSLFKDERGATNIIVLPSNSRSGAN